MAKPNKPSPETQIDAQQIARSIQRPGQTKEETKLIAQGIQKGIDLYKKQQKARARELDKQKKRLQQQLEQGAAPEVEVRREVVRRQHWLPWVLLGLTWAGILGYAVFVVQI